MNKISHQIRSAKTQLSKLYKPSLSFAKSVLIASAAVTLSSIALRHLGILQSLELGAYDQMVRLRPDAPPDSRLLIVGITEADIQRLNQWPISDRKIAEILQKLEKMQPQAIGLDVLRDVPLGDGRQELTKVLQKSDRIIGVCLVTDGTAENPGSPPPPGLPLNRIGYADFTVDPGGVLRRALLFMQPPAMEGNSPPKKHPCNDNSQIIASFNLQLALHYLQAKGISGRTETDNSLWLGETPIKQLGNNDGGYKNADDRGYQILIDYRSRRKVARQVTVTDVLEGKIDPNLVKDKIVLIGYTTETTKDYFYTPYSAGKDNNQVMPGIVAHAQVISQILSAVLDKRPMFWFWPEWAEILWIWGWSIVGGTLAWRMTHPTRLALAFGITLGLCCSISFGIFLLSGWVPVAAPVVALIVTGGSIVSADRFNKAGYGKVISDRVKQVFKIEIDQAKKAEQVAEITSSDFFRELQQKKDRLRVAKKEPSPTESEQPQEITVGSQEPENATSPPDDYFAQLQQTAQKHKQRPAITQSESDSPASISTDKDNSNGSPQTEPEGEMSQLQAKAKQMRERRSAANKSKNLDRENLPPLEDVGADKGA